jgi:hypothetical protein
VEVFEDPIEEAGELVADAEGFGGGVNLDVRAHV